MAMESWEERLSFPTFLSGLPPGAAYGYGVESPQGMRQREFARLGGITYLDHAGTALYPESLLKSFTDDLTENVYGNPHSQNISSKLTYNTIEHVRYRILQHFNTTVEDYSIIFTSGSTAALKLLAEAFPWMPETLENCGSRFCYLTDSHTSVVGMRRITATANALFVPVKAKDMLSRANNVVAEKSCSTPHLFCYPAQSNFSGTKYPLAWIEQIKSGKLLPVKAQGKWFVLLDAASYVSTSPLDLNIYQADFVPLSFYKIFGLPTGLGALLVRNEVASCLRKNYFGGGTAAAYLAEEDFYLSRPSVAERFEDGTVSFLDIIALKHGFDALERLTGGMENIKQHSFALAHYTYTVLSALKYVNGAPVVRIYSDTDFSSPDIQGPIINFNVLDENGEIIGYSQVDKLAGLYNIHMRTGCFCNTGACLQHLGISCEDVKKNLQAGHVCGDDIDVINGNPTGSVRISFGYMSTFEDAQTFLKFIIATRLSGCNVVKCPSQKESIAPPREKDYTCDHRSDELPLKRVTKDSQFSVHSASVTIPVNLQPTERQPERAIPEVLRDSAEALPSSRRPITLTNIYIYPIKSCAAFEAKQWPIGKQGLLYDRSWMVANPNGVCITQKQEPRLCLVQPMIDLEQNVMIIKTEAPRPLQPKLSWPGFFSSLISHAAAPWTKFLRVCLIWITNLYQDLSFASEPAFLLPLFLTGMDPVSVTLEENNESQTEICQSKVCSHRVQTYDCGERAADWFSEFLGRQCRLIRQSSDFKRNANKKDKKGDSSSEVTSLSLVNEAPYLLINRTSISQLRDQVVARLGESVLPHELIYRFRANMVISTNEAFEEDLWEEIAIGTLHFKVMGPCHRCLVICIDQQTGQRNKEFLQSLAAIKDRKTNFGIYLMNHPGTQFSFSETLSVGSQTLARKFNIIKFAFKR
ncbi:molybdenum cofactor sulfurase isoform X2 [Varanus komodoensis]|uniref:molybdenum cofactor sulfurase isoform X2 n=1 Tax=Varanus komodoensis TaxID=61221 RepID=UPI001CF77006|nr:molybdenum cofactor sulfurase isoform X2 [Varanus komodoensis]